MLIKLIYLSGFYFVKKIYFSVKLPQTFSLPILKILQSFNANSSIHWSICSVKDLTFHYKDS